MPLRVEYFEAICTKYCKPSLAGYRDLVAFKCEDQKMVLGNVTYPVEVLPDRLIYEFNLICHKDP